MPQLEVDYEETEADLEIRSPKARGLVWSRVGASLPGVPPGEAAGQNGQRPPGAPAGLQDIGRKMEALRTGPGFAVRPAGERADSSCYLIESAVLMWTIAALRWAADLGRLAFVCISAPCKICRA